jgi:hypothetical protein
MRLASAYEVEGMAALIRLRLRDDQLNSLSIKTGEIKEMEKQNQSDVERTPEERRGK